MPPSLHGIAPTDLSRCDAARSFLQSGFWGSFKARFAWNARAFTVDWGEGGKLPLLVIRRRLAPGASFAYVPWGPELPDGFPESDAERSATLEALALALKEQLPPDTAFVRFDPPWANQGVETPPPAIIGSFRSAGADIQPPDTVVLDLKQSEEELLALMKSKWRYNVRLAEKKGVNVRRLDAGGLDAFYGLYEETSRRDRIAIHGKQYYASLFAHAAEYRFGSQELRLYVAEYADRPIASIITLFRDEEATYLYGASSDLDRNLMPAYALQWRAIRDAKEAGCHRYDLFGIPPQANPDHPMAGLYRFKTGFGGVVLHRAGSWDYAYKPLTTAAFRLAESLRKTLRSAKKAQRKSRGAEA